MKLNPGIRKTVKWLRSEGFKTCDSGDGETHDFKCDRSYPYVMIQVDGFGSDLTDEADRLMRTCEEFGIVIWPVNPDGDPYIQATYDPANSELGIIELANVKDDPPKKKRNPRGSP